ncbi:hypothetical protein AURDEDRAFT_184960 [Auricularia subglabra TFB-10046 SS5]|nr:hypothetical protein AURDEDRAFT_184960 [Auricularia subglabra TFB-10046 SS5]
MAIRGRTPCHMEIIVERRLTNERAAQAFSMEHEAALVTTSAYLRDWIGQAALEDIVVSLDALKRLPNLRYLRMRLSREAMDAVLAAHLPLEQLRVLHFEVYEATTQSLATFLAKLPNLRTVAFGPRVRDVRQDEPGPALRLPHLLSYTQTTNFALYTPPMDAACRTLRSLSIFVRGSLPDLSHLTALSRLTTELISRDGLRASKLDQSVHNALLGCRQLRHLAIEFWSGIDEALMDTLVTLRRQLVTLNLSLYGHATVNCPIMITHIPRLFMDDSPSALRSLTICMFICDAGTTSQTIDQVFASAPSAFANCKSLVLRAQHELDKVSNGAAVAHVLSLCPNVQHLRMVLSQGALEYVSLADPHLEALQTLDLQYHNPTVHLVAGILLRCPNLRRLSLGTHGRDLRQTGPAPRLVLPHLEAYSQSTHQDLFLAPLHACARTLRALTLRVTDRMPDLSHLRVLSRLTLVVADLGPNALDKHSHSTLRNCHTLGHLELVYRVGADDRLFDTLVALMPQLITLSIRAISGPQNAYSRMARRLPRIFQDGVRTPLRALKVIVESQDGAWPGRLGHTLEGACRARRVRLIFEAHHW